MKKLNNIVDKKFILPAVLFLIALLLVALPFIIDSSRQRLESDASILSGKVSRGSISSTVSGTGTLSDGTSVEIELPDGVRLKEYLVNNGDVVSKGDPLAMVDKVTVMEAISSVQETLAYLEKEMTSASNKYAESYISSSVGGTVKKIYARNGDSVRDVMLKHGALAIVSLDGLMAVEVETAAVLSAGEKLVAILPNGTQVSATVKSVLDGKVTATFADAGYAIGEMVELETASGESLGHGETYLNRAWRATAFTGTVSGVYVYEGNSIYSGSTLFYISDNSYTADYELLAAQHREYEELVEDLFKMYQDGYISAPADGMVWGISEDTVELLAASNDSAGKITFLTATVSNENPWGSSAFSIPGYTHEPESTDTPAPSSEPTLPPAETQQPTESPMPTETPGENVSSYTYYVGVVTGSGSALIDPQPVTDVVDENSYVPNLDLNSLTKLINFDTSYSFDVYDVVLFVYEGDSLVRAVELQLESGEQGGAQNGSMAGGMSGAMGANGANSTQTTFELFPLDGTVIMTVTPMDKVSVSFSVDELDILSLSKGQKAMITIDAMPGQSFEGVVTKISSSGENRKYSVEVSFDRTERMLAGYNCSVIISIETKENILTVPVEAQSEKGGHSYLYTEYDKKSGELRSPVEIETGSSDGVNVEIVYGIQEGDEYWYAYYDKAPFEFPF